MRNFAYIRFFLLIFLISCTLLASAQDSTKRVAPTSPPPAPTSTVNNPTLTVPPIIRPLESQVPRPRRRRLTAADSFRLATQRDSIAKAQAAAALAAQAAGANNTQQAQVAAELATAAGSQNNSAFNIGTPNASSTPINDPNTAQTPPSVSVVSEVPMLSSSDNPFEILRAAPQDTDSLAAVTAAATPTDLSEMPKTLLNKETYSKNFLFWIFLLTLILMAFVVANARSAVGNAYRALLSDNALRQIYRDQMGWGSFPQLALYGLFWINLAMFVFLMLYHLDATPAWGQFLTFLACLAGVAVIFLFKHAILYIIAAVFPISKEIRLYNFIIITGGILLGLILLPLNIFIAYVPSGMSDIFIYTAIIAIGLLYAVRSLRSLSVASPYMMTDQFHFLIYLCTVEIAPLAILIKFLTTQSLIS